MAQMYTRNIKAVLDWLRLAVNLEYHRTITSLDLDGNLNFAPHF